MELWRRCVGRPREQRGVGRGSLEAAATEAGDDALVWPEFGNADEGDLTWCSAETSAGALRARANHRFILTASEVILGCKSTPVGSPPTGSYRQSAAVAANSLTMSIRRWPAAWTRARRARLACRWAMTMARRAPPPRRYAARAWPS